MKNEANIYKLDEFFVTFRRGEIYDKAIEHVEKLLIERALEYSYGNQVVAAKLLGLNRNTLHAKITKLDIDPERFK